MNAPTTALVPLDQMQTMAKACADSGLFGAKTPAQALTIMLIAQAEGRHPMSAAKDYDIIQGKPAKKAEAMLRDFLAAGGKVEWHKYDDEGADATFSHPQGGTVRVGWDKKRMQQAKINNAEMYSKYPRAMFRARCVSEGVRTVCPSATGGLYVPDEVRAMPEKNMGDVEVVTEYVRATADQVKAIEEALKENGVDKAVFLKMAETTDISEIPTESVGKAISWIKKQKKAGTAI